uniref:Ribosomal protein S16 n=1 Tax=Galega officinalis TaxID=47101 RepID=A0A7G5VV69_GALOF|nr:ribosomal protein S16 [Galega officinalis]QMX77674.1 ribosomal protein S16 [Galega officinalis]
MSLNNTGAQPTGSIQDISKKTIKIYFYRS